MENTESTATYRELTKIESEEISNIGCKKEAEYILSRYHLEVFKAAFYDEDETYFRYFLSAETAKVLANALSINSARVVRVTSRYTSL